MRLLVLVLLSINWLGGWFSPSVQLDLARIISPKADGAIQGAVEIRGTVTGIGFQFAEVSFQNAEAVQDTWFLIGQINQVVVDDVLVRWDTNALADGVYHIRVIAFYEDGHQIESIVKNVRIRNYTAIETLTTEEQSGENSISKKTPQPSLPTGTAIRPSPTALPPNELALREESFVQAAVTGGLFGAVSLFTVGFWLMIRNRRRE